MKTAQIHSFAKAVARRAQTQNERYVDALLAQQDQGQPKGPPEWSTNIKTLALYVTMVHADHAAASARIRFEAAERGLDGWFDAEDLKARVDTNNLEWDRYIQLCVHLAGLPATTRGEAQAKRSAIGKGWLGPSESSVSFVGKLRAGCLADDHLFPKSARLEQVKAKARVS